MRRTTLVVSVILLCTLQNLLAETDYASWIGMTPGEGFEAFGPPADIYVHRGENPKEDDVVFYRDGLYLFWFNNRIWQVRADHGSGAELGGVTIGQTEREVSEHLGRPIHIEQKGPRSYFYELSRDTYPIRLRVVFDGNERVVDLYLYRGDY